MSVLLKSHDISVFTCLYIFAVSIECILTFCLLCSYPGCQRAASVIKGRTQVNLICFDCWIEKNWQKKQHFSLCVCSLSRKKSNQNAFQDDYQCICEDSLFSSFILFSLHIKRSQSVFTLSRSSTGLFALLLGPFSTFTSSVQTLAVCLRGNKVSQCLQMFILVKNYFQ